jgi:hypothetical protein
MMWMRRSIFFGRREPNGSTFQAAAAGGASLTQLSSDRVLVSSAWTGSSWNRGSHKPWIGAAGPIAESNTGRFGEDFGIAFADGTNGTGRRITSCPASSSAKPARAAAVALPCIGEHKDARS